MMPFKVLGSLLLFVVNWSILGLGIYLTYDLYRWSNLPAPSTATQMVDVNPVPPDAMVSRDLNPAPNRPQSTTDRSAELVPVETRPASDRRALWWTELGLILLSFGFTALGRVPVRLLMSGNRSKPVPKLSPTSTFQIARPDGSLLYGEIYGEQHRPALVLTHGWSLDSSAWRYNLPALVDHYRVVVWDMAGLGKSRRPNNGDHSLEKMAGDLNAVLEYAVPSGPAILVGHSIGGMTLQTFGRLYPDNLDRAVKGMVLVHTTYTNPVRTNEFAWIVRPLEPLVVVLNWLMIPLSPVMWLSNWQSYFNGSAHLAARFESFTGKQSWEQLDHSAKLGALASPAVVARGNFGMQHFDEDATLPLINIPVLVVSSPNDRLTVQSASEHIEAKLPNEVALSDGGGHLGHWENDATVNTAIVNFADKIFASTSSALLMI